ncbi:MAG: single-stranded DNA-binding protein [Vagococcus sp.]
MSINNSTLVGRLTKDPELRYTGNGTATASFTLAVNRMFKSQSGEQEADFIKIVVWREKAELVAKYLFKGSLAGVVGRIQTRNYDNDQGVKVYVTEIVADNVQFLDSKKDSQQQGQQSFAPPQQQRNVQQAANKVNDYTRGNAQQNQQQSMHMNYNNVPFEQLPPEQQQNNPPF